MCQNTTGLGENFGWSAALDFAERAHSALLNFLVGFKLFKGFNFKGKKKEGKRKKQNKGKRRERGRKTRGAREKRKTGDGE